MKKNEAKMYEKQTKVTKSQQFNQELKRYYCDHKIEDHMKVKMTNNTADQIVRCVLCNEKFSVQEYSRNQIEEAVTVLQDVLNCIKLKGETKNEYCLGELQKQQISLVMVVLNNVWDMYQKQYLNKLETNNFKSNQGGFGFSGNGANFQSTFINMNGGGLGDLIGANYNKKHKNKNKNKKGKGKNHKNNGFGW